MGRHRSAGSRRGLLWGAAAVLVVIGVVSGVVAVVQRGPTRSEAGRDGSAVLAESTCDRTLRVVTASSFARVLSTLQPKLATGPDCVALDTVVVDGRAAADRVAEREADVWIPDDVSWAAVARGGLLAEDGKGGSGTVLANSPIYMVADRATAARVTAAGGSWLALARLVTSPGGLRLALRDPNGSGDGMIAAGSLGEAVWLKDGMDASSAALSAALKQTRTVPGGAAALPDRPDEVGLVPEYALVSARRTATDAAVLTGKDFTALLRYGWLPTAAAVGDPARKAGLDRLLAALKSPDAAGAYAAAKLRRSDGPVPAGVPAGWLPRLTADPLDALEPHHVDHVFAAWYVQDRRSSILLAVDVSGSMAQPAPGTSTPLITLVQQGCRAVGQMLPDQSSLGLWAFGSQLAPPRDYKVLLPTAQLTDGQRAGLAGAVSQLRAEQTGTGLYDTILAAYKSATTSWREGEANQVLVFTDGRNEDDPVSIGLDQLTAGLKAAADPKRPVELTVVAYGKLPEVEALDDALGAVHGYVSNVQTPAEVSAAFLHAAASGLHI
jgi:Bacterial extracellular solute-binding protein/von Willebrand factor type A domain